MSMFCYQCEQTAGGTGCTTGGVCGKTAEVATLQDVIIHLTKGIARYAHRARGLGAKDHGVDVYVVEALFATVTNVNFDPDRLVAVIRQGEQILDKAKSLYESACAQAAKQPEDLACPSGGSLAQSIEGLVEQGRQIGILNRREQLGDDITALQELLTYGLKGTAAYADHAQILGQEDDDVYGYFHEALDFLCTDAAEDVNNLVGQVLRCGEVNLTVMGLLDEANTGAYGHPEGCGLRTTRRVHGAGRRPAPFFGRSRSAGEPPRMPIGGSRRKSVGP